MPKTYFWLKLSHEFFSSKEIKKLRRMAGGDTYVLIYLRLMLASVSRGGVLTYDGIEDDFAAEMSLALDEDEDSVREVIAFLLERGLMLADGNEYTMRDVSEMLGKESDSASRARKHRATKQSDDETSCNEGALHCNEGALHCNEGALHCNEGALHCNEGALHCNTEKEKEIETELETESESEQEQESESHAEESESTRACASPTPAPSAEKRGQYRNVDLTDAEAAMLREEFPDDWEQRIERLSEYMAVSGKAYRSHLAVIRSWARQDDAAGSCRDSPDSGYSGNRSGKSGLFTKRLVPYAKKPEPDRSFPDGGSFDTDSMFQTALRCSYGDLYDRLGSG